MTAAGLFAAPVVHVGGLYLRLGRRFDLDMQELTIGPGITAVLGSNGSGKTTLLRLLASALRPAAGRITVGGGDLADPDHLHDVRSMLGYLPQDDTVPRRMTVFDHVDLVAVMREIGAHPGARRRAVFEALRATDVDALAAVRAGKLSGGQRRRVALAAALCGAPRLLVLDEPNASLDDTQRARLADHLDGRRSSATIVVATHDHAWASAVADRTIHLTAGRLA